MTGPSFTALKSSNLSLTLNAIGRYGIGDLVKLDRTVKPIVTITEILRKGFSLDKEKRLLRKYARRELTQMAV